MSDEAYHRKKKAKEQIQDTNDSSNIASDQIQCSTPSDFISDFERKLEGETREREKRQYLKRLPSSVRKRYFK